MSSQLKSLNNQEKLKYLNSLRVHELREIAGELNIKGRSKMRKQEFIESIIKEISKLEKPKLCREFDLFKCKGFSINGDKIIKCENISDKKYCSDHSHRYRFEKPDDCPICMDIISEESETPLECGHWIHKECLIPTNIHICPVCRQNMKQHEIDYIFGVNHQQQNNYGQNLFIQFQPIIQVHIENIEMYNNQEFFDEYEFEYQNFENVINHNEDIYQDEDINYRVIDEFEYINPFDNIESSLIEYIIYDIERNQRDSVYMLPTIYSIVPELLRENLENYTQTLIQHFGEVNNFHIDEIMRTEIVNRLFANDYYKNIFSIAYNLLSSNNYIARSFMFRIENMLFQLISEIHNIITFNF